MKTQQRGKKSFLVAIAICLTQAAAAIAAGEIDVVAISGDASPDGDGVISAVGSPAINDAGQLAFVSGLTGTSGGTANDIVFLKSDGSALSVLARKGVSTLDGTTITGAALTQVAIDADGTVLGMAALGNPTPLLGFVTDGGPLVPFVSLNSASPSGNNSLVSATYPAMNDAGVGVMRASYTGGNTETGIYVRAADGTLTTRLLQGTMSPKGGTITALAIPTINEGGEVGVRATIGSGVDPVLAVLRLGETGVVELAREGDTADDSVTTIEEIQSSPILINDSGQMAFAAKYRQPSVLRDGIFLVDDDTIRLVGPGLLPQESSATTSMRVAGLNNAGSVAFYTEFVGGGADPLSGIYVTGPMGPEVVAFEDRALPSGGKFFRRFLSDSIAMNENGQVAFLAELSNTANGPLSGRGLFLYDPDSGVQSILQTGESFEGSTVFALGLTGTYFLTTHSPDTSYDGLNNAGQVAFAFSLSNNRQGIAIWSPDTLDGDFNGDGVVDAADYVVWRKTDGSQDGYDAWRANFGRTSAAATAQIAPGESPGAKYAVPEPASIFNLVDFLVAVPALRRRRCCTV